METRDDSLKGSSHPTPTTYWESPGSVQITTMTLELANKDDEEQQQQQEDEGSLLVVSQRCPTVDVNRSHLVWTRRNLGAIMEDEDAGLWVGECESEGGRVSSHLLPELCRDFSSPNLLQDRYLSLEGGASTTRRWRFIGSRFLSPEIRNSKDGAALVCRSYAKLQSSGSPVSLQPPQETLHGSSDYQPTLARCRSSPVRCLGSPNSPASHSPQGGTSDSLSRIRRLHVVVQKLQMKCVGACIGN